MKTTFAIIAAAAGLEQVSATFGGIGLNTNFGAFTGAKPFTCPSNSDNKCIEVQIPGYDWSDIPTGDIGNYKGCSFKGWKCVQNPSKRNGPLAARTFGDRAISGTCGYEEDENPVISAGSEIGDFSIQSYHVTTEFDARLEFHYGMPDGSICKHSSPCSKGGSTIVNKQCGGAKTVKVVYPKHQNPPAKKKCGVKIHTIKFDCSKHKTTSVKTSQPPAATSTKPATTTPSNQTSAKTTEKSTVQTYSQPESSKPATTTFVTTYQTTSTVFTTSTQTISSCAPSITNCPLTSGGTTVVTVTVPVSTTICPVTETRTHTKPVETSAKPETTSKVEISSKPAVSSEAQKSSNPVEQSTPVTSHVTTIVTTYQTTSTVFTTSTSTITSCAPTVTNCPIKTGGTAVVTVTIPVSTTVCPVTETQTHTRTKPAQESQKPSSTEKGGVTTTSAGVKPTETLPCPNVVPKCLNSWLHLKKECKDNMDAACYCTSKEFTDNVFNCLYSFGGNDATVSEAISFFQGICAPFINKNPNIATGADTITSIITVTAPPATSVALTTVVVATTVTEPCVTGGTTIPGSSTVRTISTAVTVPQITISTVAPTGGDIPPATQPTPGNSEGSPTEVAPTAGVTTFINTPPVGTGNIPVPTGAPPPVIAGASNLNAGLGMGLAVMAVALAL
ncbi:Putative Beta-1,3-endoglucanase [[Torrubiella] hemipterigena]|uniref:Putative Beta-1,3-endoglucanase n=1 Tax=[Torrubiella] hemipterigena TaxID=1531966 RepID=A0A0A1TKI7_9HYPO|nr:Putative Beta-1,3-endoglucanase [[Torrubiella] hemipterigena]